MADHSLLIMIDKQIATEIMAKVKKAIPHARTYIVGIDGDKEIKADHLATIDVPDMQIVIRSDSGVLMTVSVHKDIVYDYSNPNFPNNVVDELIKILS